jgi:hypothetical protein
MANERVSKALGERFSFSVANTSGATKVVSILAAFFDTLKITLAEGAPNTAVLSYNDAGRIAAAGYPCDAVIDDGTILTGVVATAMNLKKSIRQFRDYVKENPRILIDMTVQATIPAQFNETIEVIKYSPLIGSLAQYLPLNDFRSVDQISTDKVNINAVGLEMAYDTLMLLAIPTGCTTTISFKFS